MQIQVQYFAQVRQAAGRENETVKLADGADVRALLAQLAERFGAAFRAFVLNENGDPRPGIIVLVNDQPVARGEKKVLADGNRVSIFSPVAGG